MQGLKRLLVREETQPTSGKDATGSQTITAGEANAICQGTTTGREKQTISR